MTTTMKASRQGQIVTERKPLACVTMIPIDSAIPIVMSSKCSKHWKNCDRHKWSTCLCCQERPWTRIDTSIRWKVLLWTSLNYLWPMLHPLSVSCWPRTVNHRGSMTPMTAYPTKAWTKQADGRIRCTPRYRTITIWIPQWCSTRLIVTIRWCPKQTTGVHNRASWREKQWSKQHEKYSLPVWSINCPRTIDRQPTDHSLARSTSPRSLSLSHRIWLKSNIVLYIQLWLVRRFLLSPSLVSIDLFIYVYTYSHLLSVRCFCLFWDR